MVCVFWSISENCWIFRQGRHHDEQMRAQHRLAFDRICEMRGMGSGGVANFQESADGLAWTVRICDDSSCVSRVLIGPFDFCRSIVMPCIPMKRLIFVHVLSKVRKEFYSVALGITSSSFCFFCVDSLVRTRAIQHKSSALCGPHLRHRSSLSRRSLQGTVCTHSNMSLSKSPNFVSA